MVKIDPHAVRLRHARYYQQVAHRAEKELYQQGKQLEGLTLFDEERDQIDAAWEWAREQSPTAETDELLLGFADVTMEIGHLRYDTRRERFPQLEAQLATAKRLGQKQAESSALGSLGTVYLLQGETQRAIEYQEQQLAITQEIGYKKGESAALINLGYHYKVLGDIRQAITCYEGALEIAREIGNRQSEASSLNNLGDAYHALSDYHHAIDFHTQALVIYRELSHRLGESSALSSLGNAYHSLSDYQSARRYYEQALFIDRELGSRGGEANALLHVPENHPAYHITSGRPRYVH
jgi:tetratricopeptide (TPR) repeat protein